MHARTRKRCLKPTCTHSQTMSHTHMHALANDVSHPHACTRKRCLTPTCMHSQTMSHTHMRACLQDLLVRMPRELLLLLKTNDCLRAVDVELGCPINNFVITARECTRALAHDRLAGGSGLRMLRPLHKRVRPRSTHAHAHTPIHASLLINGCAAVSDVSAVGVLCML